MKAKVSVGQRNFLSSLKRKSRERFRLNRNELPARTSGFPNGRICWRFASKNVLFHCLEDESNGKSIRNTEGIGDSPDLPRVIESGTVVVAETETSPTKHLTVLHVAATGDFVSNDDMNVVTKGVSAASQWAPIVQ